MGICSAYLSKIDADMRPAPADIHDLTFFEIIPWVNVVEGPNKGELGLIDLAAGGTGQATLQLAL